MCFWAIHATHPSALNVYPLLYFLAGAQWRITSAYCIAAFCAARSVEASKVSSHPLFSSYYIYILLHFFLMSDLRLLIVLPAPRNIGVVALRLHLPLPDLEVRIVEIKDISNILMMGKTANVSHQDEPLPKEEQRKLYLLPNRLREDYQASRTDQGLHLLMKSQPQHP